MSIFTTIDLSEQHAKDAKYASYNFEDVTVRILAAIMHVW